MKNNINIYIPYKMYIYLSKKKNLENKIREQQNKKLYTLSSYCNFIIKSTLEKFLDLNDYSYSYINSRSRTLRDYQTTKICKRKINIAINGYSEYIIKELVMEANSLSFSENVRCIFNLFIYLEEGETQF